MCRDTVFLGQSHIYKFTESISLNQVQAFLELCVETTTETLLLLGIIIRVTPRVLAQMIKSLCILEYSAGALCECQKFIQLPLHQSFRNMVCPEGSPKFLPGDNMASGLHGTMVIPPNAGSTTKLLSSEVSFTRVRTRYSKKGELRVNSTEPSVGIKWFFSFTEQWRLGAEEILIACHLRIEVITTSS
jgi:hypothetical protein